MVLAFRAELRALGRKTPSGRPCVCVQAVDYALGDSVVLRLLVGRVTVWKALGGAGIADDVERAHQAFPDRSLSGAACGLFHFTGWPVTSSKWSRMTRCISSMNSCLRSLLCFTITRRIEPSITAPSIVSF